MAKSQAEQIRELADALTQADVQLQIVVAQVAVQDEEIKRGARRAEEFIAKHAAADERVVQLRAEVATLREELRRALDRLVVSETKIASLEERSRHHEKSTDRGWQLWLAALGFGFGLMSLLVTGALQLKK